MSFWKFKPAAALRLISSLMFIGGLVAPLAAAESPRERLALDVNWRFHLGDIPLNSFPGGQGIALYGLDFTHSGAKAGHIWGAATRGFDDKNWRQVNPPDESKI